MTILTVIIGLVIPSAGTAAGATALPPRSQTSTTIPVPAGQIDLPATGTPDLTGNQDPERINPCRIPGLKSACKKAMKWLADHFPLKQWAKKGFNFFKKKVVEAWKNAPWWVKAPFAAYDLIEFIEWLWDQVTGRATEHATSAEA